MRADGLHRAQFCEITAQRLYNPCYWSVTASPGAWAKACSACSALRPAAADLSAGFQKRARASVPCGRNRSVAVEVTEVTLPGSCGGEGGSGRKGVATLAAKIVSATAVTHTYQEGYGFSCIFFFFFFFFELSPAADTRVGSVLVGRLAMCKAGLPFCFPQRAGAPAGRPRVGRFRFAREGFSSKSITFEPFTHGATIETFSTSAHTHRARHERATHRARHEPRLSILARTTGPREPRDVARTARARSKSSSTTCSKLCLASELLKAKLALPTLIRSL